MAYLMQSAAPRDLRRLAIRLAVTAVLVAVVAVELDAVAVFLLLRSMR